MHGHRRRAHRVPRRPARRVGRQLARRGPGMAQLACAIHLRVADPDDLPVPRAARPALAAQRPHAHQHRHDGLRLHPGPDGRVELRLLRCHRRRVDPGAA